MVHRGPVTAKSSRYQDLRRSDMSHCKRISANPLQGLILSDFSMPLLAELYDRDNTGSSNEIAHDAVRYLVQSREFRRR